MSTNSEVIAHYLGDTEGDAESENLFTKGPVLYSYGLHWPLAVFQGEEIVINATRRSNNSTRHLALLTKAATQQGITFRMSTMEGVKEIIEQIEGE